MVIDSEKGTPKGIAMTEAIFVLASVTMIPIKVIKTLPSAYQIPDPLPWSQIAGPLVGFTSRFQLKR